MSPYSVSGDDPNLAALLKAAFDQAPWLKWQKNTLQIEWEQFVRTALGGALPSAISYLHQVLPAINLTSPTFHRKALDRQQLYREKDPPGNALIPLELGQRFEAPEEELLINLITATERLLQEINHHSNDSYALELRRELMAFNSPKDVASWHFVVYAEVSTILPMWLALGTSHPGPWLRGEHAPTDPVVAKILRELIFQSVPLRHRCFSTLLLAAKNLERINFHNQGMKLLTSTVERIMKLVIKSSHPDTLLCHANLCSGMATSTHPYLDIAKSLQNLDSYLRHNLRAKEPLRTAVVQYTTLVAKAKQAFMTKLKELSQRHKSFMAEATTFKEIGAIDQLIYDLLLKSPPLTLLWTGCLSTYLIDDQLGFCFSPWTLATSLSERMFGTLPMSQMLPYDPWEERQAPNQDLAPGTSPNPEAIWDLFSPY